MKVERALKTKTFSRRLSSTPQGNCGPIQVIKYFSQAKYNNGPSTIVSVQFWSRTLSRDWLDPQMNFRSKITWHISMFCPNFHEKCRLSTEDEHVALMWYRQIKIWGLLAEFVPVPWSCSIWVPEVTFSLQFRTVFFYPIQVSAIEIIFTECYRLTYGADMLQLVQKLKRFLLNHHHMSITFKRFRPCGLRGPLQLEAKLFLWFGYFVINGQ